MRRKRLQRVQSLSSIGVDQDKVVDVLRGQRIFRILIEALQVIVCQRGGDGEHLQARFDTGQITIQRGGQGTCVGDGCSRQLLFKLAMLSVNEQAREQDAGQRTGGHEQRQAGANWAIGFSASCGLRPGHHRLFECSGQCGDCSR